MSFPVVDGVEVLVEPPEGYQVNFTHPHRDEATINSSYWAFGIEFFFAVLFLGQRVYTASFILREWRSDDCKLFQATRKVWYITADSWNTDMIVLAFVLCTAAQALILHCLANNVLGVHIWEMSLDDAIWETTVSLTLSTNLQNLFKY
jgi:hypothetical protein